MRFSLVFGHYVKHMADFPPVLQLCASETLQFSKSWHCGVETITSDLNIPVHVGNCIPLYLHNIIGTSS